MISILRPLLAVNLLLANVSIGMTQEPQPTFHDEAQVPAIRSVLAAYETAPSSMDAVAFKALFYNQLSPIYGVTRENSEEVRINLHASDFIDRFIRADVTGSQEFWNVDITVDGTIAVMNADFNFFVGGERTNWGTESWHLVNTLDGWKILAITFSRRPDNE